MFIARALRIEVGARTLLDHASFSLNPGDKVGLVGHNGAGKTTLLRTLAGELEPAGGRVARRGVIGYLSQETALPGPEAPLRGGDSAGWVGDPAGTAMSRQAKSHTHRVGAG